jgi:hypothetical protein
MDDDPSERGPELDKRAVCQISAELSFEEIEPYGDSEKRLELLSSFKQSMCSFQVALRMTTPGKHGKSDKWPVNFTPDSISTITAFTGT